MVMEFHPRWGRTDPELPTPSDDGRGGRKGIDMPWNSTRDGPVQTKDGDCTSRGRYGDRSRGPRGRSGVQGTGGSEGRHNEVLSRPLGDMFEKFR